MTPQPPLKGKPKRVLAVSSRGGHWVQLIRLRPAFEGHHVAYVTTDPGCGAHVAPARLYVVGDATRWNKLALIPTALKLLVILLRERPHIVISTGAAPGYVALRLAKLMGAKTVWIDSIANIEELSMSGKMASKHVTSCLTQWEHLAQGSVRYEGAVL